MFDFRKLRTGGRLKSTGWLMAGLIALGLTATVVASLWDSGSASAAPGDPGTATFTLVVPGGSVPVGNTVDVQVNLSQFTPSTPQPKWGGYDLDISYAAADGIVTATQDVIGASNPCGNFWTNNELTPQVVSGCSFQSTRPSTPTLETVTFQCLKNGTQALHLMAQGEQGTDGVGTDLFDETAAPFVMTLVDAQIVCGTGNSATDTPTNTPVPPTDTPTNTPVPPTDTPTNTPVPPTDTPTNTPVPPTDTPTNTPVPPTDTPTNTPVPPTDTPTNTPVGPTDTPDQHAGAADRHPDEHAGAADGHADQHAGAADRHPDEHAGAGRHRHADEHTGTAD